ncbi:hypothetical protein CALCODRAFT_490666 [Calocera cornea HHB12733]|uniref:Uncharacterized protein n=1 Tax=Calocera cornea HHB12733 TaxID=1353952 RepID=A0A165JFB2_9BASI|nr:hypothetical protein CALCODRAFT_490666 [Calocera cornea HHB12733]
MRIPRHSGISSYSSPPNPKSRTPTSLPGARFLHLSFLAPPDLLAPERVQLAWATLLLRHPLLLSSVVVPDNAAGTDDVLAEPVFRFAPPANAAELLAAARERLTFARCTKAEFVHRYMNGEPRSVGDRKICLLTIAQSPGPSALAEEGLPAVAAGGADGDSRREAGPSALAAPAGGSLPNRQPLLPSGVSPGASQQSEEHARKESYDLYLCAPHFSGDALPLHQSAHDLLALLAEPRSVADLQHELDQLAGRWDERLPRSVEALLPPAPTSRLARAAAQVNYLQSQEREVGGHVLPRQQRGPMKTVLLERGFSRAETTAILALCKKERVSANHAVFALVDVAWANMLESGFDLPIMNYTALSLRPYLTYPSAEAEKNMSYWFVALTYFNIVLPSFLPRVTCAQHQFPESTLWERARSARDQIGRITRSRFLVHRARIMGAQRAERAGKARVPVGSAVPMESEDSPAPASQLLPPPSDALAAISPRKEAVPSKALMGISLMGNLDKVYLADQYPDIELLDVATASRQKAGGILFLAHTFAGRMWLHMAYDENGFAPGSMERFWEEVGKASDAVLIGK